MHVRLLTLFCMVALNFEISSCKTKKNGASVPDGYTLKNIFVTFRSHEHNATDYPKGPNITGLDESLSNLTEYGKDHAYSFGQYLRANYSESLNLTGFSKNDFYCKGTSTRRTQESAMFVEAGLLGNGTETTQWTKDKAKDYLFEKTDQYIKFYNRTYCPEFYRAEAENINKTNFNQTVENYFETVKKVTEKYPDVTISIPATVWLAYETFWAMKHSKEEGKLPTNITDDMMQQLKNYSEHFIYTAEATNKTKKLSGGVMVDGLLSKFESKGKKNKNSETTEKNKDSMRKMSLLAAPQAVLGGMIGAFSPENITTYNGSAFNAQNFYPGNGSYHILEHYEKNDTKQKNFRVIYTPGWGIPPMPLIYKGCDSSSGMCTLQQLKTALRGVRLPVAQQNATCDPKETKQKKSTNSNPKKIK